MKPVAMLLASAALSAGVGGALVLAFSSTTNHSDSGASSEVVTLRSQLDEMSKELTMLRQRVDSQTATASTEVPLTRTAAEAPKVKSATDDSAPAIQVPTIERDMILAVIEQREKDKERERKEKQRQQAREAIETNVKRAADRVGLDPNTTASITKLYLESLAREEDIRRAYPVVGQNDPNAEKSRLEIDAARTSLDTTVASMIPTEKAQEWNNQSRWLRRTGDVLYNADQMASGSINIFGGMMGGRGGADFGGGGPGGARGGNNNNNNRQGGQNQQKDQGQASQATGALAPAPPTNPPPVKQP